MVARSSEVSGLRHHVRVSAHSFVMLGERPLLACREGYLPDVVALYTESEFGSDDGEAGEPGTYGYVSTVREVRDRLQLHGFTEARARAQLNPDPPSCPLSIMVRRDLVVQGVRARRYGRAGRLVSTVVSG